MPHARRVLSSCLSLALIAACNPPAQPGERPAEVGGPAPAAADAGDAAARGDAVAELTAVSGPAGARTEDLAEGTFLGAGAKLRPGQTLAIPRGTLAEVRLRGGTVLRLNEDTRLTLPEALDGRSLALVGGELVAIVAAGQPPLSVRAGADVLDITQGEARALSRGERGAYDVVYGTARLRAGGQDIALGPGAHVDTPLAEPARPVQPEVSLRPLEDTAWAQAFEVAARMADSVPAGVGSLTARRAGSQAELYKLALIDQKVHVSISGRIARTEIEQSFYNEAGEVLEGTYRFPLPADASISGLSLLVGDKWMDAEMLEKQRARDIFRQIVEATVPRDPALLEWERGNIFKLKIFPIPGRGERRIRLSYTQILPAVGDTLRYRYPMSGASSGATGTEIENFEFTIAVDRAELPAGGAAAITTPMAELQRREQGERVELSTRAQRFRPVHDLGADIPLPPAEQRLHAETHLDRDGQAYFMLAFRPEIKLGAADRPRHYAFVLDRSHSTTPELWTVARSLVQATAATLGEDDRMTVLACDAACDIAPGGLQTAARPNLDRVETFLDGQVLAGASDLGGMMRSAAEALGSAAADPKSGEAERVIVYLGDGNPSAGELAPDELLRHLERPLAGTRVQAVALGARSDLTVLSALTRKSGGDLLRADAKDDLRALVRELRLRGEVPVARDVDLTLPEGMLYVHPEQVSALRPGDTVTLLGKLSKPVHGPLTLRATGPDGQVVQDSVQVDLEATPGAGAERRAHLPRTWAREEIEALTATRGHAARPEIIELSRRHNVLSRYTALLVLENDAMYREFNVVRQSGRTTGWNGQLGAAPTGQPAAAEKAGPVTTPTAPKAEAAAPEPADMSSRPAPPPAPSPAPDRAKRQESAELDDADERLARGDARELRGAEADEEAPPAESPKEAEDILEDKNSSAREPAPSTSAPAPAKKAKADLSDPWDGLGGGGSGKSSSSATESKSAQKPGGYYRPASWKISAAGALDSAVLAKLELLRAAVERDPTSRAAHRKLVQAAIRAGAADAFAYARAWSAADPDHAPAVLAVADLLAARSDPAAPRAYGSAAELTPFDKALQTRLADAYASKGDLARSCAHRRAVVSIDPARGEHHLELARCLAGAGRTELARDALQDGLGRAKDRAALSSGLRDLDAGQLRPLAPALAGGAELRAELRFTGPGDVDIAVVDPGGRRLSALRPQGVRVRESTGGESLTVGTVRKTLAIEVTRASGLGPVSGELVLKTPTLTRTFPFTLDQGSLRLASIGWVAPSYGRGYYYE